MDISNEIAGSSSGANSISGNPRSNNISIKNYQKWKLNNTRSKPYEFNELKNRSEWQDKLQQRKQAIERLHNRNPVEETSFNNPAETRIQIEPETASIAESTPLLGTAGAGGSALFGGAGSAIGGTGSALTGILGATVIGGGAVAAKGLYDRVKEKGAVLPGSEYIGPGNPIPISAAKNPSEQIAKDHDLAYANAKTHSDVQSADKDAYTRFRDEHHKSGSYYAKIGQLGLQAKAAVEKVIGVQYPRLGMLFLLLLLGFHS